ncbi:MAG: ribonuclease III family protein [Candidatus Kariarchaeaceae archaeon]|jgi:hypothetical protein
MVLVGIKDILENKSFRNILKSKNLAQLGDFLANFIYTSVKIGLYGIEGSVHVWDNSLTKAMELADLRKELGKKTKPDKVADAGEALIAYAYFNGLLTIDEMVNILDSKLDEQSFKSEKIEKEQCALAFSNLFRKIFQLAIEMKNIKILEK